MKRLIRNVSLFMILLLTGMFFSCHRSVHPSWDTNILAPIVNTNLSINDLLTSSYLQSNADSSITLVYSDSLYNFNIDTLLNIPEPDTTIIQVSPFNITIQPGNEMFTTGTTTKQYDLGSVQLKNAITQSGYMEFVVTNKLPQPVDYYYKVPSVTINGNPLQIFIRVPALSADSATVQLGGYTIDFSGSSHNSFNTITTYMQVDLDTTASALAVVPGDTVVDAKVTFYSLVPYYGKGYFGTSTKTYGPEKVAFPIFNKIVAGSIGLQAVNVSLTLQNGFGVDASVTLTQLTSKNSRNGTTVNLLDNQVINSVINIDRATQTYNSPPASPVNPSVKSFTINGSNSNIIPWVDNLPDSVIYAVKVTTDPLGNVSGSNDFAFYGYGIKSYLNITIPLSLIANNLTLVDTTSINLSGSSQSKQVKNGTLTLYAVNGFPFSAGLQLYLLNSSNVVSDSLFIPIQTVAAGNMNSSGVVISPQNSTLIASLDATRTQELLNAKKVVIVAKFNMSCPNCPPPGYTKIYNYYHLSLKLVGNIDYEINGD